MLSSLFHRLPEDQKKKIFKSQKKEGIIFHTYSPVAKKKKFLVIIGETGDSLWVGHVLINSKINKNLSITPELQTLHMPIYAKDYNFLSHDSYIDCTNLYDLEYKKIETIAVNNPLDCKGMLTEDDISTLKYMIKNSPTIKNKIKKKYGYK